MKNATLYLASTKNRILSFKKFGRRMEHKRFNGWYMKNVTYRIRLKPVDQSLKSANSEVIYFLLYAVFLMLNNITVTRPIRREFSLDLTAMRNNLQFR